MHHAPARIRQMSLLGAIGIGHRTAQDHTRHRFHPAVDARGQKFLAGKMGVTCKPVWGLWGEASAAWETMGMETPRAERAASGFRPPAPPETSDSLPLSPCRSIKVLI